MGKRGKKRSLVLTRQSGAKKFCGQPSPLDSTEPPTLRQIIQYNYFLENSQPHLARFDIIKLIVVELQDIWGRVNPRLPVYDEDYITKKVSRELDRVSAINRKKLSVKRQQNLEKKLDFLFDIARCSCSLPVVPCSDKRVKCSKQNCNDKHLVCTCDEGKKCPTEERQYLKDQRSKMGPKGLFQLGTMDKQAAKRQQRAVMEAKRRADYTENHDLQKNIVSTVSSEYISHSDSSQSSSADDDTVTDSLFTTANFPTSSKSYSYLKTPRFGMELIRGDVSSSLGASLGNALMLDLHSMGLFKLSVDLAQIFLDKSKIDREKARVKDKNDTLHQDHAENLICIGIDGKVPIFCICCCLFFPYLSSYYEKVAVAICIGRICSLLKSCQCFEYLVDFLSFGRVVLLLVGIHQAEKFL